MGETEATTHLYLGGNTPEPVRLLPSHGEAVVFSQPCPTAEAPNQDSAALLVIDTSRSVLVVADGVGGLPGGRNASARALEVFSEVVERGSARGAGLRESILDGFEAANRAVCELGSGSCTTIVAASIVGDLARCYHVGDSSGLVVGQRGKLKHATIAHSPVGYAVESGMLDEDAAMTHADRNVVSNVIGSSEMKIEIGPKVRLAARDTVFIGSDGVFDNLAIEELVTMIRTGRIEHVAQRVAATCRERMTKPNGTQPSKPDDTTFVVYRPHRPKQ